MEEFSVSIHPHKLIRNLIDNGWRCNGVDTADGCKNGCTDFYQTEGWSRYRCQQCDFDLCYNCLQFYVINPEEMYRTPYHHHLLTHVCKDTLWYCNGRNLRKGCAFVSFLNSSDSKGLMRFRCSSCDFDLCKPCLDQYEGKTIEEISVSVHPHMLKKKIWDLKKSSFVE